MVSLHAVDARAFDRSCFRKSSYPSADIPQADGRDDVRCDLPTGRSRWGLCAIGALLVAKARRSEALAGKLVRMGRSLNLDCRSLQDAPSLPCSPTTRPVPARPDSLYLGAGRPIVSQPRFSFCSVLSRSSATHISVPLRHGTNVSEGFDACRAVAQNFGVGSPSPKFHVHPKQGSS